VKHLPKRRRLALLGMMGHLPYAGMAWQVLHYVEGLRRLGHEVIYIEDTLSWPFDPERRSITDDCGYTVKYIAGLMEWCGLPHAWAYRAEEMGGRFFGLTESEVARQLERADALINLHGITDLRDGYLRVPVRIYLETDPVAPQIEIAKGVRRTIDLLAAHTHHFTYAENLGAPDCGVPVARFDYRPTRQPVVLDWWAPSGDLAESSGRRFTTIASWRQTGRDIEWNGETLTWSKDVQFLKFLDLPRRSGRALEVALAGGDAEARKTLASHGWGVVDAIQQSLDIRRYRDYVAGSHGEFTVAKEQNVRLRSGWFSDRSACYLAAGKPVITQDTGFGNLFPTGRGLFAFHTLDQVLEALDRIETDYATHARVAREIACEYFAADRVLSALLERSGL
jgi:hypothetical protein